MRKVKKSRPPKTIRERNKLRCSVCRKKELLDAIEKIDRVCYSCKNKNGR